ncbi:hypothetical protein, partial [Acinetobacter sp. YH12069]|uniref:hypothetical protein n=1 Tax=Acinetobacter sp. YH12069 TaxID=2601065 RepID=UPI001C5508B4
IKHRQYILIQTPFLHGVFAIQLLSNNPDKPLSHRHQSCGQSQSHHESRIGILKIGACESPE